ncbi:MAG: ABC transporter ATP-binding protein/permease [Chitinophagaceae bacterium]|nr:ABC transporter ATP-binding protein/permease [Chitinophagaceae bacterium]
MKHLKTLFKYFKKYRWRYLTGIFFVLISNYFNVLSPQVTGFIIDHVQSRLQVAGYKTPERSPNYDFLVEKFISYIKSQNWTIETVVAVSGIVILVLALLRGFFLFLMRQTLILASRYIEYDQKNEIYRHYQQLDMLFYKQNSTGDLMNRMTEDVSRVRMFTGPAIMYMVNLVAVISLSVFFMFKRDPELTFYVLAPLPVLAYIIYSVNNKIYKKSEEIQEALSDLTSQAQETYSGIRVVKSFAQESSMTSFFESQAEDYRKKALELARTEAIYFPAISLLIGISTLLTIFIGGMHYIRQPEPANLSAIVEFVIYVNMLTFPASAIGLTASMIQRAAASQKRINEFLNTTPAIRNQPPALQTEVSGNIEFRDVSFTYPHTGIMALKQINLKINKGEKVAILGKTGSGKTTLAHLLLRFVEPDMGEILIDQTEMRKIDLNTLRKQISYVPQDVFLFSDTIEENIRFGQDLPEKTLQELAEIVSVHHDIMRFPEGYKTLLGERGINLSGGQKQRITLARALAKDAPVYILDDCLSAVDSRTERQIVENLKQHLKGKTLIFITHRMIPDFGFDKIVVMYDGKIIEKGTHEELLKHNGFYQSFLINENE